MADKLKKGIAVVPTFSDGEAVRAGKLTALARQAARAVENVEKAVGDIYDESFPYSTGHETGLSMVWGRAKLGGAYHTDSRRSLDITNVGRLIGSAANLNPHFPMGEIEVTQTVPDGLFAFTLKYPADSIVGSTDASLAVMVSEATELPTGIANRYKFVSRTNEIVCNTATTGGTITYLTTPEDYASGENYTGATFNVIPDPIQIDEGGDGCEVSASADSEGRHIITLPTLTHLARNESDSSTELDAFDVGYGSQLVLPFVLTEAYAAGEVIPAGFLYLKNHTTRRTYRDAIYTYIDESNLYVSGIDLEAEVTAGDKFTIVTVGTDITTSIDDLRRKVRSHSHNGAYGDERVEARHIAGWTRKAGESGAFVPSDMEGNYAPQYLHRDGKRTDAALNDDNAMRGDLYLGRTAGGAGTYLDLPLVKGETYGVYFGGEDWGIRRNGDDDLLIRAKAGEKVKVYGADVLQVHSAIDKKGANEGEHTIIEADVFGTDSGYGTRDVECGFLFSSSYGLGAHRVTGMFDGLFIGQMVDTGGTSLFPWVLDVHGTGTTGFGTYDEWVVPKINIVHWSKEGVECFFKDSSGGIATQWQLVTSALITLDMPSGFDPHEVLSLNVLVSKDATSWYTLGAVKQPFSTEDLICIGAKISGSTLEITIPTKDYTGNPFSWDDWRETDAITDSPHAGTFKYANVKVTLTLAGQTRAGIQNMVS